MLRSMTGFGAAQGQAEGVEYAVEIRSVNNRYFKLALHLPEVWSAAEPEIEKLLRGRIHRGTVTLTVRMKVPDALGAHKVNTAALSSYVEQLKLLEVEANPTLRIDLAALLQLPGVCEPPPLGDLCRRTQGLLTGLIAEAADQLVEMRRLEGRAVRDDLLDRGVAVSKALAVVAERSPQVVLEYHERLKARVQELTDAGKVDIDSDVLAREVAIFAERCDIAEEVSRLSSHVDHFRAAMDVPEPAGRKLDFIAQEMLREANTIASKANDAEVARTAVELKTAIDRIKEQVQNVE